MRAKKSLIIGIRWFARILGIISGLIVLYFGVLDRILEISWYLQIETHLKFIVLLAFLILILSGIVIAWFREAVGGMMILLGYVFSLAFKEIEGSLFWPLPIAGLLFLFCWWQSRKLTSQAPSRNVS
jgi:hypothetical protein